MSSHPQCRTTGRFACPATELEVALAIVPACPPAAHAGPVRRVRRHGGPAPGVRGRGGPGAAAARGRPGPAAAAAHQRAGPGRAPGAASRASWWPSTCGGLGADRATAPCAGRCTPGRKSARSAPPTPTGRRTRFTFTPERWGRRQIGTVDVVLRDRWRLAEGHATVTLPTARLLPRPGAAADPGRAQAAAEPARRASGPDLRRGHRVLRRARVRARRPAAQHQLAGQHPARAAAGEHLRRRALAGRGAARRRHLGRGRARSLRRSTSRCAARRPRPAPTWTPGTGWA